MKKRMILYAIFTIILLYFVEQVWLMPWLPKTFIKVPMFTIIPLWILKGMELPTIRLKIDSKHIKVLVIISLLMVVLMSLSFAIAFYFFLDLEAIRVDVTERMALPGYFLLAASIYTIVVNAFIEEVFFRGFIFRGLSLVGSKKMGYILSALIFATYHIAIVLTWFSLTLLILVMCGLFVGGLIFAYVEDRTESILGSWIIHAVVDAVFIGLGLMVIGIG